jgi:hypothetical protein
VGTPNVTTVYTLADNTFGTAGATEFSVTFNGTGSFFAGAGAGKVSFNGFGITHKGTGGSITGNYVGADNTKDYNLNCGTTGCDNTPNAQYWYDNGNGQWLQIAQWTLPANFGLTSITFNQVNGSDGAILAGITLQTSPGPTPGAGLQGLALLALMGAFATARALLQR